MEAKKLLNPRYEVIADYPSNIYPIGKVLECPDYDTDFTKNFWCEGKDQYPHLFRKMDWWEKRKKEDMPKKLMSLADDKRDTFDIVEWDMELLIGYINLELRKCCSLLLWSPKHGYIPID